MVESNDSFLKSEIEKLKDPLNIHEASFASSAKVLTFAFESDPNVMSIVRAGQKALTLIAEEIKQHGAELNDISLSCFAYILQKIDATAAVEILWPIYQKTIEKHLFFSSTFVAHAIRKGIGLPVKDREFFYTQAELQETYDITKAQRRV